MFMRKEKQIKTKMKMSSIKLIDLPTELLLIIFKKLNHIELFYSLMGINKQFDRILFDPTFTDCLTINDNICPLDNQRLDRDILPQICNKIKCLTIKSLFMEQILSIGNYPNLSKLCLFNIDEEGIQQLSNEKNSIIKKVQHISTFHISILNKSRSFSYKMGMFFENMFKMFPQLTHFEFHHLYTNEYYELSLDNDISPTFISSTLLELHLNVSTSMDLLCLLDGRLSQLRRFYVFVQHFFRSSHQFDSKENINHLECFSLTSRFETFFYKETILPLLYRMSNLETLTLNIRIDHKQFLDGNCLNSDFLNHLSKLNHFIFNIQSRIYDYTSNDIRLNEDIENTFKNFQNSKIISYVDYFPEENYGQCHCYSYPYTLKYYDNISNRFPGGLFKCVTRISLYDERPFQHEFFFRISQSFPLLKRLTMENYQSQNKNKSFDNNNNNRQHLSPIEYHHIERLELVDVHDDYIKQFLCHSISILSNWFSLSVKYDSLERVTNHFTREQTKMNSAKVQRLILLDKKDLTKDFYQYFPSLQSC